MHIQWVPIVMFISIAVILGLAMYFRYRVKQDVQTTVQAALDKGQELSPEMLEKLGESLRSPRSDLRRGILAMSLGVALVAFGFLLGEEDAQGPLMAIAAFPFIIGVAYLGLHKFGKQ